MALQGHDCAGKLSHSRLQFSLLSNGDIVTLSPFIAGDLGEIMEVKSAQKTSKHYHVLLCLCLLLSFFLSSFLFFFLNEPLLLIITRHLSLLPSAHSLPRDLIARVF